MKREVGAAECGEMMKSDEVVKASLFSLQR